MIVEGIAPIHPRAEEENLGLFEVALHNLDNGLPSAPGRALPGVANRQFAGATKMPLPRPALSSVSLADALAGRQSSRAYSGQPLSIGIVGALLQASFGVSRHEVAPGILRRSYPSGGGLFPVEAYLLAQHCDGIAPGFYHYDPASHELADLRNGVPRLADYMVEPPSPAGEPPQQTLVKASMAIVLTSWLQRSYAKYGERAWKLALIEAGHIGQNMYVVAAALQHVGVCAMGGFAGPELEAALGIDGAHEKVLYPLVFGHVSESSERGAVETAP